VLHNGAVGIDLAARCRDDSTKQLSCLGRIYENKMEMDHVEIANKKILKEFVQDYLPSR
jgi:hypothetical protein